MSEQLTLGISPADDCSFDNFFPAKNSQVINDIRTMAAGRGKQYVFLWGISSSGCTHLLQASCRAAKELNLATMYIDMQTIVESARPDVFEDLEALNLVALDNVHVVAGRPAWEEALFHFYNRIHESGRRFIIASHVAPKNLNFELKDLSSRLNWGVIYQLHVLNDAEKLQALHFRADLKGFELPENVAQFLLRHCDRNMKSLAKTLEILDQASLSAQRKLTIPFVKNVLNI